jgi:hypothetical protein
MEIANWVPLKRLQLPFYRKNPKSKVGTPEILVFPLVCASGVPENRPTMLDSPESLLVLPADRIAINPALANGKKEKVFNGPEEYFLFPPQPREAMET